MREMTDKKTILLIDDDEFVREACCELLQLSGYTVDSARNGFEALQKIEGAAYDLIVVDINMPQIDGIDFYLRAVRQNVEMKNRFLFITGDYYGEQEALNLYLKADRTILKKPFTKEAFLQNVQDVLSKNP